MEKAICYEIPSEEEGLLVKDVIKKHIPISSRQLRRAKFREEGITVNGVRTTVRHVVHAGDVLRILLEETEEGSCHLIPIHDPIDILYEDEDLLVINKPAGIVVHPSHGHYADSLANRIAGYYEEKGLHVVIRPIGRLDKDTSGVILFAKNPAAASLLEAQRRQGILHRCYLALCEGCPDPKEGIIELPVGKDPDSLMKMMVTDSGSYARTDYQVLETGSRYSLLRLILHTGRTHQIRVHLSSIGHPLLGDPLYHPDPASSGIKRTALHAFRLSGRKPFSGEPFLFTCPPPEDFQQQRRLL